MELKISREEVLRKKLEKQINFRKLHIDLATNNERIAATVPEANGNIEHVFVFVAFSLSHRRLLTQLEAAKGSRGSTAGDSKLPSAKGPDGVVLYELHSRPEQEKFNESAKVQRKGVEQ